MSKVLKITLGVIAALVLIIFIALNSFVKPAVEYGFHRAGFPKATVESAEFSLSGTTLKNLKLDDAGATVGEAKLFATVSDALAGQLTKIEAKDVKLALPLPPALSGHGVHGFNLFAKQIEVADALVTVQTPLGALPVKLSGTVVEKSKDYLGSFTLDGDSDFAKLKCDLTATFAKGGSAAKLDFRNIEAKLSHDPDFDMKRITGFVTATLDPAKSFPAVDAQLDLGMLRVYGVPLQGVQFIASAGTDKSEFIAKGQVQGESGDFMFDLKADHKDPVADKTTLYGEAKLYKLDSLNIENMKGQGNIILQLNGTRTRGAPLADMSAWKDLQGSAGLSLEKLSLPHLLSDAEALATMKLSFDPAKQILTAQATDGNISFSGVYKKLDQLPLYLNIPFNGAKPAALSWDAAGKAAQADFDGASFTGLNIQARQVNAHVNVSLNAAPVFKGNLDIGELAPMAMRGWEYFIPVKVTAVLQPQTGTGAGSSVTDIIGGISEKQERLVARIDGRYDSATGRGGLAVNMPPTLLRENVTPLASLFPFSQHYLQNGYGTLGLSGAVEWSGGAGNWTSQSNGELYLKDFTASVRGTELSDVNTVMKLDSLFPLTLHAQSVAVGALNLGLPLTNGTAVISLDPQGILAVQQAAWSLAGGKVTSDNFSLSLKDMTANTSVQLHATGLDLGQLFKIAPMEGMEATGKVNGTLPLQVRNGDIQLLDGDLGTTGPGTIRYSPKSIPSFLENASAQQFIDLKTALLQFNYDRLDMKMSGPLSQSLKVNLHVQGKNPLFYSGHPVDFSLNLEGPLEHLGLAPGNGVIPDLIRTQMQEYEKAHGKL